MKDCTRNISVSKLTGLNMSIKVAYLFLILQLLMFATSNCRAGKQKSLAPVIAAFNNETCHQVEVLAQQVDACTRPLMDLLEGTLKEWPHTEQEMEDLCDKFGETESCVRDRARKCAIGLNKVIVSTHITSAVAASVRKTKDAECVWEKHGQYLKLSNCIENNLNITRNLMAGANSRMMEVERMPDVRSRTTGVCCALKELEQEMYRLYAPVCKDQVPALQHLFRSNMEDVINLLCSTTNCDGFYKTPADTSSVIPDGFVTHIMKVVFSLGG